MDFISLYELNCRVKEALKERFAELSWVTAEIASVQENRSGHCYLELVDKPEGEENVTAVAKGTVWSFTYRMLKPYFETTTGRRLEKGMKILIQAEVVFHEVYGFSLNIKDIDPTYTVGDLERKKREILLQLEQDGIIDMNKQLELPALPKNIAVISSATAAGLGDFLDQLENNSYGYRFHVKLFPAVMQGERTTESVIAALDRIYEYESLFDVVVIIRGGGSQTDLGSFDTYDMAANVAQFPLPVIAGIGHERDETIVDRVAWLKVKTPTAAAAYLIETFLDFDTRLEELKADFCDGVQDMIDDEKNRQLVYVSDFRQLTKTLLDNRSGRIKLLSQKLEHVAGLFMHDRIAGLNNLGVRMRNRAQLFLDRRQNNLLNCFLQVKQHSKAKIADRKHTLELAELKIKYADPKNVLARGYSITRLNGRAVTKAADIHAGDILETVLADGKVTSKAQE